MNRAMIDHADWAFIAGLLNAGNASLFVNGQGTMFLAFYLPSELRPKLEPWLRRLRGLDGEDCLLTPDIGRSKVTARIRVRLNCSDAVKVLNKSDERLFSPRLKAMQDLAQAWWRTKQLRGRRLPPDALERRRAILAEIRKLKRA